MRRENISRENHENDLDATVDDGGAQRLPGAEVTVEQGEPSAVTTSIRYRWGGDERVIEGGFLAVPRSFFFSAASLGLTPAESAFVLQLMSFKWSEEDPYPGYDLLAQRLGVSPKQARKYAQQLEDKGLLRRIPRFDAGTGDRTSNAFDLQPLFRGLARAVTLSKTGGKSRGTRQDVSAGRNK